MTENLNLHSHDELIEEIASYVCNKPTEVSADNWFGQNTRCHCQNGHICKVAEKTQEQLSYVLQPLEQQTFLSACPGSGKTEVVGLKAAYEIQRWESKISGIAFLTFTNNAADVIKNRIVQFAGSRSAGYPHYVGTIDSWLHRYIVHPFGNRITGFYGENGDGSLRIIESNSSAIFLSEFQTQYQYFSTGHVLAHQYYFDIWDRKFVFSSGNVPTDTTRNDAQLENWRVRKLAKLKDRFISAGYATYQDMEHLSYLLLQIPEVISLVANRFPHIVIDECQDLSGNQLKILELLIQVGVSFHFVGDLDQSIYAFKGVTPENIQSYVEKHQFETLELTANFRSLQPIVNICDHLVDREGTVGRDIVGIHDPVIVCFLFLDEGSMKDLPNRFENYLANRGMNANNSAILARNYTVIGKIRSHGNSIREPIGFFPARALRMWSVENKSLEQIQEALLTMGKYLAEKVFSNFSTNSQQWHSPEFVKSPLAWRLCLNEIMNLCCGIESLVNFNQSWSVWVKIFKDNILSIIENASENCKLPLPENFPVKHKIIAPRGNAKNIVEDTLAFHATPTRNSVRVSTFHKVKGETLDAVMVVSKITAQGNGVGFYWKQWLEDSSSESARLAYVASSRPRELLAWAIPERDLNDEARIQFEELGFTIIES